MESIICIVMLWSALVLINVDSQTRRTTRDERESSSSRPPPSRNASTASSSSSSTTTSTTGDILRTSTTTKTTSLIPVAVSNDETGLLSTEAVISLYCLVAVLVIIIVVIVVLYAWKTYKKKMKMTRFTRNMQSNYVMYSEHNDNDMHSYTNPNFHFCGDNDNEYTEIEVEHMVKLKSVKARSFRTLSCKLSQSEERASHKTDNQFDDTENEENGLRPKGSVNIRTKEGCSGVREDSSGYLVPGSDFADDEVFVDIHKGKDDHLEISTANI